MTNVDSKKLASVIARTLDDKKADDILVLDVSSVCVLSDYFVIVSANSATQVKGLTSALRERIKELFNRIPNGDENDLKNRWNLLDYGDVIVHIMYVEQREIYGIEKFWNHALKVPREEWEKDSIEYSEYSK